VLQTTVIDVATKLLCVSLMTHCHTHCKCAMVICCSILCF